MSAKQYRPSNGTEGFCFIEQWCATCARDAVSNGSKTFEECADGDLCQILADTFAYDIGDPEYPKDWVYDEQGRPTCSAWVANGEPIPTRCTRTKDMFDG